MASWRQWYRVQCRCCHWDQVAARSSVEAEEIAAGVRCWGCSFPDRARRLPRLPDSEQLEVYRRSEEEDHGRT